MVIGLDAIMPLYASVYHAAPMLLLMPRKAAMIATRRSPPPRLESSVGSSMRGSVVVADGAIFQRFTVFSDEERSRRTIKRVYRAAPTGHAQE